MKISIKSLRILATALFLFATTNHTGPSLTWAADLKEAGARRIYRIDAARSRFAVQVFAGGLLKAFGHHHTIAIRDFSGTAETSKPLFSHATLQMRVRAASLAVVDEGVSEKDRAEIEHTMREKVLEVSQYPEIEFLSTGVDGQDISESEFQVNIRGNMKLHSVTRSELIPMRVKVTGNELRAHGEFSLKQTDYGIRPVAVAGGTVKVKNGIKLSFDIIAVGNNPK